MTENNNTIAQVVKDGLCTGCGTCIALCPEEAIKLTINEKKGIYVPELNEDKCNNCGICYEVCPGHEVDFKQLNLEIFGKEPEDIIIGNYLNCYFGHATDYNIRYNSSSGGLVTALLIFALEEGIIDGALVTRMKKDNPLEPESFIARTGEEIIEASKSKYCPVPANIALKEILDSKEGEKFAVVGLPCHIHGVRKAEQINKKLKEKIVLHLGIFCNHAPNFWGTKLLLQRLKVREDEVIKIGYRGEGYPGSMKISKKSGELLLLLLPDYWNFVGTYFFYPARCLMCSDGICELADISFGDAWLPELSHDKIGLSIVVSKSGIGEKILQMMKSKNKIELEEISVEKVIRSQAGMLYFKKKDLNTRNKLFKVVPKYNMENNLLESAVVGYLLALFPYLNSYASSNPFLRKILCHIPSKLIWLYGIPYSLLFSKKAKNNFKKFL
jgi:coenzyme F420 hydrogenase subunit beta